MATKEKVISSLGKSILSRGNSKKGVLEMRVCFMISRINKQANMAEGGCSRGKSVGGDGGGEESRIALSR